jgi:hypothetical protein
MAPRAAAFSLEALPDNVLVTIFGFLSLQERWVREGNSAAKLLVGTDGDEDCLQRQRLEAASRRASGATRTSGMRLWLPLLGGPAGHCFRP